MRGFLIVVVICWSSLVFGKGPEITGPEKIKIGHRCVLKVVDLEDGKRGWVPMNLSNGAEIFTFDKGTTLVFFTGNKSGTYTFLFGYCEDDEEEIEYLVHELTVEGTTVLPPPLPPTPPVEPPKPPPAPPGEQFGLITLAKNLAIANGNGPPESVSLAAAYRAIAAQSHKDVQSMVSAQKEMNRALLGSNISKWVNWFTALAKSLGSLQKAGKLITLEQNKAAWREIATGLEAVK